MNFWSKKINSDEYERISKKITELNAELDKLSNKFNVLETNYNDLRGKFNRKLSGIKKEEVDVLGESKTEGINNTVILPWNGNTGKFS